MNIEKHNPMFVENAGYNISCDGCDRKVKNRSG